MGCGVIFPSSTNFCIVRNHIFPNLRYSGFGSLSQPRSRAICLPLIASPITISGFTVFLVWPKSGYISRHVYLPPALPMHAQQIFIDFASVMVSSTCRKDLLVYARISSTQVGDLQSKASSAPQLLTKAKFLGEHVVTTFKPDLYYYCKSLAQQIIGCMFSPFQ